MGSAYFQARAAEKQWLLASRRKVDVTISCNQSLYSRDTRPSSPEMIGTPSARILLHSAVCSGGPCRHRAGALRRRGIAGGGCRRWCRRRVGRRSAGDPGKSIGRAEQTGGASRRPTFPHISPMRHTRPRILPGLDRGLGGGPGIQSDIRTYRASMAGSILRRLSLRRLHSAMTPVKAERSGSPAARPISSGDGCSLQGLQFPRLSPGLVLALPA